MSADRDLAALLEPGTLCLVLSWHGWPCCYGRVREHGVAGDTQLDVWYAVEALTPVIDWGVPDPAAGYVSRQPGEVFNAHHNELVPLAQAHRTFTRDVVSTVARLEAERDAARADAAAARESERRTVEVIRAWWEVWAEEGGHDEAKQMRLIAAEVALVDAVEAYDALDAAGRAAGGQE